MSSCSRPDRISCDAFSDINLYNSPNSGVYNSFNNNLSMPLLNVKGIQLLRVNFVNNSLQLNDYNGQLIFVYSRNTTTAIPDSSTFHVVRLHPSFFVPYAGYTAFVKNKYFNNGTELVAALNAAASTGGDTTTYNPSWLVNDVSFSFDTTTRKISLTGLTAGQYYAPVAADHPALAAFLASGSTGVRMNSFNSGNTYATAIPQYYNPGVTMNARLGFGMNYNNRGVFWNGSSILGCATSSGVPQLPNIAVEGDSWPILIGSQNLNIYCNAVPNSGQDSRARKNLLANVPIENAPLGVCSYTLSSVEAHQLSVGNEIYNLQFYFTDDEGNPFYFSPNFNMNLELAIYY